MYIVFEVNNSNMIVAREFPLLNEDAVERFVAQTNIKIKKELLKDIRFAEHLFSELEDNSDEQLSYMVAEVTLH